MSKARILLVDDHPLVCQGFRALLEPTHEVIGLAHDGATALAQARRLWPEVVLLDLVLTDKTGLDVCRELKALLPQVKVLVVTMQAEKVYVEEAFRAGASGFVTKLASEKDLLHAIAELRAGRSYRMPALERYSRPDPDEYRAGRPGGRLRDPLDMLSPRQRQVFLLTGYGKTTQEIAEALGVGLKTIEYHRVKIEQSLGLTNTRALMRLSIERVGQGDVEKLSHLLKPLPAGDETGTPASES